MPTLKRHRLLALLLVMLVLPACTTMQTTYFRGSYQELARADNPILLPPAGQPGFSQVDDMAVKSREMLQAGYMSSVPCSPAWRRATRRNGEWRSARPTWCWKHRFPGPASCTTTW